VLRVDKDVSMLMKTIGLVLDSHSHSRSSSSISSNRFESSGGGVTDGIMNDDEGGSGDTMGLLQKRIEDKLHPEIIHQQATRKENDDIKRESPSDKRVGNTRHLRISRHFGPHVRHRHRVCDLIPPALATESRRRPP